MTNRVFRIHPAIGFARVGTSQEYYLAPETMAGHPVPGNPVPGAPTTGGLPIQNGTESTTIRDSDLRDADGNLKRQAARFRIYSYQASKDPETYPMGSGADPPKDLPVEVQIGKSIDGSVDGKKVADIVWTVHVANKKTGWYESDDNRGIIAWMQGKTKTPPLRNANLDIQPPISDEATDTDRWTLLFTDPGPRAINGTSNGPVKFDDTTIASYGNGKDIAQIPKYPKTFPKVGFKTLYPADNLINTLGEIETDQLGRLIVVGAFGRANSFSTDAPKYGFDNAVNNDWWFDDTGDGPVTATLVFEDGSTADVEGHGWVISTDPAYAPQIVNVVSLWDDIYDSWVRKLNLRPDLYPGDDPENRNDNFNKTYKASFEDEIRPIFLAAGLQRWITNLSVLGISAHESIEKITFDADRAQTQLVGLGYIREPVDPENLAERPPESGDDRRMPFSLGDAGRGLLSMTYTQYFYLKQWDAGTMADFRVELNPGEKLDKAALVAGLGGRFSPGIDMTYICREPDLYVQDWQTSGTGPFRINCEPLTSKYQSVGQAPFLTLGWIPRREKVVPLEPGDISKFMAIPWHADYNSCATHTPAPYAGSDPLPPEDAEFQNPEFNNTLFWSWPAQRPVAVYTAADVTDGKTLGAQRFSVRGPGTKTGGPGTKAEGVDPPFGPADPAEVGRYQMQDDGPGIARILDHWMDVGTVIQATNIDGKVEYDPDLFLEVQSRLENDDSDVVQPWPNTIPPGSGRD